MGVPRESLCGSPKGVTLWESLEEGARGVSSSRYLLHLPPCLDLLLLLPAALHLPSFLHGYSRDFMLLLHCLHNACHTAAIVPASSKTARIRPLVTSTCLHQHAELQPNMSFFPLLNPHTHTPTNSYVCHYCLLNTHQSCLKKAHSTKTALLAVTESLPVARASALSHSPTLVCSS